MASFCLEIHRYREARNRETGRRRERNRKIEIKTDNQHFQSSEFQIIAYLFFTSPCHRHLIKRAVVCEVPVFTIPICLHVNIVSHLFDVLFCIRHSFVLCCILLFTSNFILSFFRFILLLFFIFLYLEC